MGFFDFIKNAVDAGVGFVRSLAGGFLNIFRKPEEAQKPSIMQVSVDSEIAAQLQDLDNLEKQETAKQNLINYAVFLRQRYEAIRQVLLQRFKIDVEGYFAKEEPPAKPPVLKTYFVSVSIYMLVIWKGGEITEDLYETEFKEQGYTPAEAKERIKRSVLKKAYEIADEVYASFGEIPVGKTPYFQDLVIEKYTKEMAAYEGMSKIRVAVGYYITDVEELGEYIERTMREKEVYESREEMLAAKERKERELEKAGYVARGFRGQRGIGEFAEGKASERGAENEEE